MNYSSFRLTHPSQINQFKEEMGEKEFYKYAFGIYRYFANMETGNQFDVTKKVAKENTDKFVKITCLYAVDFPGQLQINESFTQITKL